MLFLPLLVSYDIKLTLNGQADKGTNSTKPFS